MQQQKVDEQFGPVRDIKMRCNYSNHNIHQAPKGISLLRVPRSLLNCSLLSTLVASSPQMHLVFRCLVRAARQAVIIQNLSTPVAKLRVTHCFIIVLKLDLIDQYLVVQTLGILLFEHWVIPEAFRLLGADSLFIQPPQPRLIDPVIKELFYLKSWSLL
jgi:hypothetical protein